MNRLMFSVIIPTYNRHESLQRCLASLSGQTLAPEEFEVIVVDDGSSDKTPSIANDRFPFHFRYVRQNNEGPSAARNRGALAATGEYLAFTEDDVLPDSDWLEKASARLSTGEVDMLEGRTTLPGNGESVRRFEPEQVPSFIPCNLFVKRSLFNQLGGYDTEFFDRETGLYFREDADFGFRALNDGANHRIAGDVVVSHPVQFEDAASCLRHAQRYMFDPLLYRKHRGRFRTMIEVKTILGMQVRRPQHLLTIASSGLVVFSLLGLLAGSGPLVAWGGIGVIISSLLFRWKYQGSRVLRIYQLQEVMMFVALPFVYLYSMIRGCIRFRSWGALLW